MSDGRKYYCFCDANCKFETMTKEQILAAIAQAAETGLVFDENAAFITKVKESNAGGFVSFWLGTQAQYNAIEKKDPNCFYILTDCDAPAELTQKVKDLQQRVSTLTAADVGAAPAGYGLGDRAIDITGKNLNDYTKWGVYYWGGLHTNAPFDWGYMEVIPSNGEGVTQVARKIGYVDGTVGIQVQRTMNEWGTWSPWEWDNPPMALGVEYRTTERWNGATKYTKHIYIGQLADTGNKVVSLGIPYNKIVTIDIYGSDTSGKIRQKFPLTKNGAIIADAFVNSLGELVIGSYANNMYWEAYAIITYEK